MIIEFKDENFFLSNFYPAHVMYEGTTYPTAENAYQAAKTLNIGIRKRIFTRVQPRDAKRLGRGLKLRPDWEEVKLQVMEDILTAKFSKKALANKLIATEGELIEGNWWGDTFWGMVSKDGTLQGENHLGKILMKIRDKLREEQGA